MRGLGPFLKDAWRLALPYFRSEERWSARLLLFAIVALNLAMVGMSVILNFWNRLFYNSLQNKDWRTFIDLLFWYRKNGHYWMPGFCEIVAVFILVYVYATYLSQWLQIRWRRWMTRHYVDNWLADRAYYRISLTTDRAAIGTDNPDQRIAEDIRDYISNTLSLGVDFLSNVVSLFSFVGILWGLSGDIRVLGINIPGYMVWVAIVYAIFGTWLTHLVGRPLIPLRFQQQRREADFRYSLVRLRENAEGVALYGGEGEEKVNLIARFHGVMDNWWGIMQRTKQLNALTTGYSQIAIIFPIVVAAPRYFAGEIELGGLTQTAGAFGQVQSALSWFVQAYSQLALWRAIVERLTTFQLAIDRARAAAGEGIGHGASDDDSLRLQDVTLALPDGGTMLEHLDVTLRPGSSVVLTGRSGTGKSSLFRAIAGIWPFGKGDILRPAGSVLFLPQRPYIPLGTLRHVITYPEHPEAHPQAEVAQALTDAGLPQLIAHLDEDENWPIRLSGGEQQRVAMARALLAKPDWLFLDEATASLDPESEAELYGVLHRRLPDTTIVSIAHRASVADMHERRLVLKRGGDAPGRLSAAEPAPAPAGE